MTKKEIIEDLLRCGITSSKEIQKRTGISSRHIRRVKELYNKANISNNKGDLSDSSSVEVGEDNLFVNYSIKSKKKDIKIEDALNNPKFKDLISASYVNIDNFEVQRFIVNSWDVTNSEGNTYTNYQLKIWFKKKQVNVIEVALKDIEGRLKNVKTPKRKKMSVKGDVMVEVGLYDHHFGMFSWHQETEEDYDLSISRKIYNFATDELIERVSNKKIDYFLYPIGNDFLHIDNSRGFTPAAGNQLDFDTRPSKILEEAEVTLVDSISKLSKIAPVKICWVPGNHDPLTSFYLLRVLNAYFRNDKNVEIDTSKLERKYIEYGNNLICLMHGCKLSKLKEKQLAGLMADEAASMWKAGQYREIHKGHFHKEEEFMFGSAQTYGSVVVRTLPSLSATDFWHYGQGYTKTPKVSQYFVWHKTGLEEIGYIQVPEGMYRGV